LPLHPIAHGDPRRQLSPDDEGEQYRLRHAGRVITQTDDREVQKDRDDGGVEDADPTDRPPVDVLLAALFDRPDLVEICLGDLGSGTFERVGIAHRLLFHQPRPSISTSRSGCPTVRRSPHTATVTKSSMVNAPVAAATGSRTVGTAALNTREATNSTPAMMSAAHCGRSQTLPSTGTHDPVRVAIVTTSSTHRRTSAMVTPVCSLTPVAMTSAACMTPAASVATAAFRVNGSVSSLMLDWFCALALRQCRAASTPNTTTDIPIGARTSKRDGCGIVGRAHAMTSVGMNTARYGSDQERNHDSRTPRRSRT